VTIVVDNSRRNYMSTVITMITVPNRLCIYVYILYLVAAAWVGTQCCKTVFHQYDQSSLALKQDKQATQSVRMLKRLVHSNDNTCSRNMKKSTHHPAPKCADQIPRLQPGAHLNALAAAENERK
jgi:hypothetical protein